MNSVSEMGLEGLRDVRLEGFTKRTTVNDANGSQPPGYTNQAKTHNAVAVAVVQGRADWGVGIQTVARQYGLGFLPIQAEHYDFVIPKSRSQRPPVLKFVSLLRSPAVREALGQLGFELENITVNATSKIR
jgi:molybdate-binding protein